MKKGGHLAEIDSEKEYLALEDYWKRFGKDRLCSDYEQTKSWWLGITDSFQEGSWVADTNGAKLNFTMWNGGGIDVGYKWERLALGDFVCSKPHLWEDQRSWFWECVVDTTPAEPNNLGNILIIILSITFSLISGHGRYHYYYSQGPKVPGEDCAIAHLWEDNMEWYDVPCNIRGFHFPGIAWGSNNPFCEHEPLVDFGPRYKVEGLKQVYRFFLKVNFTLQVQNRESIGNRTYKFIKTKYGVTRDEAREICEENGGFLAIVDSDEERKELQHYYFQHHHQEAKEKNFIERSLVYWNYLTGSVSAEEDIPHGWWVGANDEEEEGLWVWEGEDTFKKNVNDSSWFLFGRGNPDKLGMKYNKFGDDDCAMIVDKQNFLR